MLRFKNLGRFMDNRTYARLMAVVTLGMCVAPGYADDVKQPPKIVKVEPVQARVDVLGCGGPSVSLNLPKWKCDKEHHGDIISAYRVTYLRGNRQFVTVLPYNPEDASEPVAGGGAGVDVDVVLREVN
jgi:hypothetical protein